jgi:alpha-galactosidase
MPITWKPDTKEFHLSGAGMSYIVCVFEGGALGQLYFGPALDPDRSYRHLYRGEFRGFGNNGGEFARLEYPVYGRGDFRSPALSVSHADGSSVLDLVYAGHRIVPGKPAIPGLPSSYAESPAEAETLEVDLRDEASGVEVTVYYTVFEGRPIVARSAAIRNGGSGAIRIGCAMSASLDLPDADWELMSFAGGWARERELVVRHIAPGSQGVSSARGASSAQANPFIVLKRPDATEARGEAYGFSLVYSGNFLADAEVDQYRTTRARIGINPSGFSWKLESGAEFRTPEAVLAYSSAGLGALSDSYHSLYRERLARGAWRDENRPVLINNWEGTYFDFDEGKLLAIASAAKDLGVELFVLDDGWFGKRDDDASSLGDWTVDRRKLPKGIDGLARSVQALGLKFGLWFEPEMVSPVSELFKAHPGWAVGVPGRPRTEFRNQLVLDFSRPEVVSYVFEAVSKVLSSAPVSYVKWDMNRNITEPYSLALPPERQGEFFHRYMLGVYELYDRLTRAFPKILFESCASGGGRFDPGMLAFAPQGWASDDSDAVERLKIQWGTSFCYPLGSIGAHVSAVPNHQVGRTTPLSTRAAVAFFGAFGYELDATKLTEAERAEIKGQIAFYKRNRSLIQRGRFVRLQGPYDGDRNQTAWMVVSEDRRRAIVAYFRVLNRPNAFPSQLRLRGLDPKALYSVSTWPERGDAAERNNTGVRGGDELMGAGLLLGGDGWDQVRQGDFWSRLFLLEAESSN